MVDIKTPEERSRNMSKIRSSGTKPEEYVRKLLFGHGYRYLKNTGRIPGHPDAWLARYNTAVFVHGCFWHRHEDCKYAYTPKSRVDFWTEKFRRNVERDRLVLRELDSAGIKTLVIWECTVRQMVKSEARKEEILKQIETFFSEDNPYMEI